MSARAPAVRIDVEQRIDIKKRDAMRTLRKHGIPFEAKNNGTRLIIRLADERCFDFYPKSGKWHERSYGYEPGTQAMHRPSLRTGLGILNLVQHIGGQQDESTSQTVSDPS